MDETLTQEPTLVEGPDGSLISPEELQQIEEAKAKAVRKSILEALGLQVAQEFNTAKTHRIEMERRWIDDLRQFKGVYDTETAARLAENEGKRAKLFLRLTRAKVKSTNARMADMLFPAGDKNWSISATPVPSVDPASYQNEIAAIQATQGEVSPEVLKDAIGQVAKDRASKMSKEIDDQLEEGGYESACRKVIASGNLFGTGILKGPMGSPRFNKRWRRNGGDWEVQGGNDMKPSFSFVPIWHYYPDPEVVEREHCAFEIEWHPMNKFQFQQLRDDPSFMRESVDEVLKRYPSGDSNSLENWESDLRQINKGEATKPNPSRRFVVLERWGTVSGAVLAAAGMKNVEEMLEYEAQVWVCGGIVIRAQINPYDTNSRPFKLYYFDKDETSIWGEGIPSIMRDTQKGANTSIRAMVDNAAASAIPMFEVNVDLMSEESDFDSIRAGRTWKRKGRGVDSQYPAVRAIEIPAKTEQFMALLRLFIEMGDEITTLPRYTYGSNDGSTVSKTVGGLSMLMGQANISLKESVKAWDDGITTPFISDMYAWNMQFSSKPDIKGDYDVIARGSSSLVAKEVRANALAQFTLDIIQGAPELAKKRELFAERARNLDLDPDIFILSEEEVQQNDLGRIAQEALTKLAAGLGLPPDALLQNFDQFIATTKQLMTQAAAAEQAAQAGAIPTVPQGAPVEAA